MNAELWLQRARVVLICAFCVAAVDATGCSRSDPDPPAASIPVIPPGRGATQTLPAPQPGAASPTPTEGVKDPRNPVPPPPTR